MTNNLEFILKLKDLLSPAMGNAANLTEGEASKIATSIRRITPAAESANVGLKSLKVGMTGLMEIAAPFIGVFAGFEFLKGSTDKFNEAAQAQAQLAASLRSTKGAAGLSTEALDAQAEALQKTTLYEHDATTKLQSLLLTFTNIKGAVFTQAVPAIQDLATKMGYDLKDAAVQVGKALNDPIHGITALKRVGVSFSETQIDVIKHLVKTGHAAEAQAIILKELNKEFGGSAGAAAKAGTGPFTQLAQRFNDVRESIGGVIVKLGTLLIPLLNGFVTLVDKTVKGLRATYHWIKENSTGLEMLGGAILGAVTAYKLYAIWSERAVIWSGIKTAAAIIEMGVLTALGTAIEFVNAMFLASPIGWIVLGISALVAWIIYLVKKYDGWGQSIAAIWEIIKAFGAIAWIPFKSFAETTWFYVQKLWFQIEDFAENIMGIFRNIGKAWDLATDFKFGQAADALTSKITTNASIKIAALEKEHASKQANYVREFADNGAIINKNLKKIGLHNSSGISAHGINPAMANGGLAGGGSGSLAGDIGDGKHKAHSINHGGQRSIVINIAKQIEKLEVHVMDAKEGAAEIEGMVRDAMRRVVYSLNGVAS